MDEIMEFTFLLTIHFGRRYEIFEIVILVSCLNVYHTKVIKRKLNSQDMVFNSFWVLLPFLQFYKRKLTRLGTIQGAECKKKRLKNVTILQHLLFYNSMHISWKCKNATFFTWEITIAVISVLSFKCIHMQYSWICTNNICIQSQWW